MAREVRDDEPAASDVSPRPVQPKRGPS
jgi:hypothetical protein